MPDLKNADQVLKVVRVPCKCEATLCLKQLTLKLAHLGAIGLNMQGAQTNKVAMALET